MFIKWSYTPGYKHKHLVQFGLTHIFVCIHFKVLPFQQLLRETHVPVCVFVLLLLNVTMRMYFLTPLSAPHYVQYDFINFIIIPYYNVYYCSSMHILYNTPPPPYYMMLFYRVLGNTLLKCVYCKTMSHAVDFRNLEIWRSQSINRMQNNFS